MADSVGNPLLVTDSNNTDRVFAHAVSTVKKIPRAAGTSRPPLADRLLVLFRTNIFLNQLYGLYKQATEGDIPEIISRPDGDGDEYGRAKWFGGRLQR